jgi:hypothetical protein
VPTANKHGGQFMGRRRLLATVVISGLIVGVMAAPASGSFTKKQACKLITKSDIEGFFGTAPTQTTEDGKTGKFTTCTWKIPVGGESTVFVGIDKVNKANQKDFDQNKDSPTAEKVPGIKKGFIDGVTVTFIKNGNFVNVQHLAGRPTETDSEALVALAKEVYGKL